jgi:hypothetical protein
VRIHDTSSHIQKGRTKLCVCEKSIGCREKGGGVREKGGRRREIGGGGRENGVESLFYANVRLHLTVTRAEYRHSIEERYTP